MMRLCVDFTRLIPKNTDTYHGGGYYLYQILNGLLAQNRDDLSLTIIWPEGYEPRNEADKALVSNQDIHNVYSENVWDDDYSSYDTLFLPLIDPWNFKRLKMIKDRHSAIRIVATLHDLRIYDILHFDSINRFYFRFGIFEYTAHYIKRLFTFARCRRGLSVARSSVDLLMTDSNYSMQQILKHTKSVNMNYFYLSIDCNVPLSKKDGEDFILFVSANREEKNFIRSLRAYVDAVKENNNVSSLYVTGSKDKILSYINRDKALDKEIIASKVKLLGYVTETEMQSLYANCEFLLYTSKSEGFGLPALNAAVYGRPVVASNRTSIPEVLGSTALYVDPYDQSSIKDGILRMSVKEELNRYETYLKSYRNILIEKMQFGEKMIIDNLLK